MTNNQGQSYKNLVGSERPEFTPVEIPKGVVEAGSSIFYKME